MEGSKETFSDFDNISCLFFYTEEIRMELKKNQLIPLTITGVTAEGAGVGKYEGMAVFVPMTAPGDQIQAKIVKVLPRYAFGIIDQLLVPSEQRVEPDCPVFAQCGGCCYRHISYEAEAALKSQRVKDTLERIAQIPNPNLEPILAAPSRNGYRNKALLPLEKGKDGSLRMGFYAVHSHRVVDCPYCQLQPKEFNTVMEVFRKWSEQYGDPIYDESTHQGVMRRLYIRKAEATGELMVCPVVNGNGLHHEKELLSMLQEAVPNLTSFIINTQRERTNVALGKKCRTVFGKDWIEDTLCGLQFQISPLSFYQVNRTQAQRLYEKAAEYAALTGEETLLDLYCGTGTIGLSMAHKVKRLIGVEIIPDAVENAKRNAKLNGITNSTFYCADAAKAAEDFAKQGIKPDVIIIDPPRKGCGPGLVDTIAGFAPKRVVYVSCDPATLARDLKQFAVLGYHMVKGCAADLFPGTAHVETVCLLER